jgi:glucuronokinase
MKYLTCIFRFFVRLLGKTFRQMFGGEALGALNIKMVDVARSVGAAAKFTGSGGAVVAFCPDGPTQVSLLESECKNAGFTFEKISVVPSFLSEDESKPLKIC